MKTASTNIPGCILLEPEVHRDQRGSFLELYNRDRFSQFLGDHREFVQQNLSVSARNVLRGLHYQRAPHAQAKLVWVARGAVRDVVVDLRPDSPSTGEHFIAELRAADHRMLYIPRGCAHGFLSLEADTQFAYMCDAVYHPESEAGIRFDDPDLGIDWGVDTGEVILSDKDRALPGYQNRLL